MRSEDRRLGVVKVSGRAFGKDLNGLVHLFKDTLVLDVREEYTHWHKTYTLWHESFDVTDLGAALPEYEPEFDTVTGAVTWRRKEK